jgi:hypothetical protein
MVRSEGKSVLQVIKTNKLDIINFIFDLESPTLPT